MKDENNVAEKEADAQAEAVTETNEAPVQQPVALNIQDLANIRKLFDIASQRGAFKPEEFQIVGAVYSKLSVFVDAALAAAEQQKAETVEAPAEPEVPAEAE